MARKRAAEFSGLPSREDVLAFIREEEGKVGKREIARAFGIKGADRIGLKRLLGELAEEGLIEKRKKRLRKPGTLPPVTVLMVTGRDDDGEIYAEPSDWDEEEHGAPPRVLVARAEGRRANGPQPGLGDRILARISEAGQGEGYRYTARVMRVLDKARALDLGVFRADPGGGGRIEPVSKKNLREYRVPPGGEGDARDGELVSVETARGGRLGPPMARVKERLGPVDGEKAVSEIAIHAHAIPNVFAAAVLEEARAARPATLKAREDWRDVPLVTIDPADAKDHDDAVHAAPDDDPDNPDGFVVIVAIADVSHFVRPGSAMDREAIDRGNSVYFPDRVVPMLPERISNDLCSLRPDEDRAALAMRMVIGADGRKRRHSFHRVMMRSAARLAYRQAQAAMDGAPDETTGPLLEPVLKPLWGAYAALKQARESRAPLDLDLPERRLKLDASGAVESVVVPERLDAHRLVEEFMIQANVAAAETLEAKRAPVVYRIHDAPSLAKLEALREFLKSLDLSLPKTGNLRPSQFNTILAKVDGSAQEQLVNEVVLRSQSQAEYSPDNIGHFGLNLRRYAHFTSPIRRYADLLVHRSLVRALGLGEGGLEPREEDALAETAARISAAERRAMAAERETIDRLIAHYLVGQVGAVFQARISGVTRAGLFVKLAETGADGFVPIATIGAEYYAFDEARQALVGAASGTGYRLGDEAEVRLVEAAPLAGALRFEMLSEGRRLATPGRGGRGPKGAQAKRAPKRQDRGRKKR